MAKNITGPTTITGTITGAVVSGQHISGSITNAGYINANGLVVTSSFISGQIADTGTIVGGLSIDSASRISAASLDAIDITGPTLLGGIVNSGTIESAHDAAVLVNNVARFSGGIGNSGAVSAGAAGIVVHGSVTYSGVYAASTFAGGINNGGTITTGETGIEVITIKNFSGGIGNGGTISAGADGISVGGQITTYPAYVTYSGIRYTYTVGSAYGVSRFAGGINNNGTIRAADTGISVLGVATFTSGITNSGTIFAADGKGIEVGTFAGSYFDSFYSSTNYVSVPATTFSGGIVNSGGITAHQTGVLVDGVLTFVGGVTNTGTISADGDGVWVERFTTFAGGITNAGAITARTTGIAVGRNGGQTFSGSVVNSASGTISAAFGIIVRSVAQFGSASPGGGIVNSGAIAAGNTGIAVIGAGFSGGITNAGTITERNDGIILYSELLFSGGITNTGVISGAGAAFVMQNASAGSGSLVNGGTLGGNYGIELDGATLGGSIINTGSGVIDAATGISFQDGTLFGSIVDSGSLTGGISFDSASLVSAGAGNGISITGSTFLGGIANAGLISAAAGAGIFVSGVFDFGGNITNVAGATIAGVVGINLSGQSAVHVVDTGEIIGTGGTAIVFDSDPSTLTLTTGFAVSGAVLGGGGDTLQLGGAGNDTFDLSGVGAGQKYSGFTTLEVIGGTWSATGSGQDWLIEAGALIVTSGATLTSATVSPGAEEIVQSGGTADVILVDGRGLADLQGGATAVSGAIEFAGTGGTLDLGGSGGTLASFMSGLAVSGLVAGDFIDLTGVPYSAGASATSPTSTSLDIAVGGVTYSMGLTSTSFANDHFWVAGDGGSGTVVFIATSHSPVSTVYLYSGVTDEGDIVLSGGTMIITSGAVASNTTVDNGGSLIIDGGGLQIGGTNSGTVVAAGGVLSGNAVTPFVNDGTVDPANTFLAIVGDNINNSTIVASAAGSDGFAHLVITGGTLTNNGSVEAIATSATTSAVINLSDAVSGPGLIQADGNAAVYIDGASISGGALQTSGASAFIGVVGGSAGSASISGATFFKGTHIFADGMLNISAGTTAAGVTFLAEGPNAALTLSGVTLGTSNSLTAEDGGVLSISAASGGSNTVNANTLIDAVLDGKATIIGGVVNSAMIEALAFGGVGISAVVAIAGGSAGKITNAKGALIEAKTVGGYGGYADTTVSTGGAVTNSGTVGAYASASYDGEAALSIDGGSLTNAGTMEALATSNTTAYLTGYGIGGVTNSSIMLAAASNDSDAFLGVQTSGGTISNTRTIEAAASEIAGAGLGIVDQSNSASLINANGAVIEVTATAGSVAYDEFVNNDPGLFVGVGGSITNAGTIALAVSDDSNTNNSNSIDGASLINTGTIEASATDDSRIGELDIEIASAGTGGKVVNSGTIAVAASDDSFVAAELFGSGIVNSGGVTATANAGSTAYIFIHAVGSGAAMTNAAGRTIEASATGAGSTAYLPVGGENETSGTAVTLTNTSATLEATAAGGGTAYIDLGTDDGTLVVGGTLKTTGADASIGAFDDTAAATGVTIAPDSNIVAFEGMLTLSNVAGPIGPGTLVEAAYGGTIDVYGNVNNGGILEALAVGNEQSRISISAGSPGTISNTGTMEAVASGYENATAELFLSAGSAGTFTNKGTVLASTTDVSTEGADFTIDGGLVTNAGTIAVAAVSSAHDFDDNDYGAIYGSSFVNTGNLLASASDESHADFYIHGTTSTAYIANSGTILALATDDSNAYYSIDGGTILNTKTIAARAFAADAGIDLHGSGSASTVSNTGSLLASAVGAFTENSIQGGTVTNAKGATIAALTSDDGEIVYNVDGLVSGGLNTGIVTNSGTMFASATTGDLVRFSIEGGTTTNAAGAIMEAFATSTSRDTEIEVYGFGSSGLYTGIVANSGALLVSANGGSNDNIGISIDGGTVSNVSGGTIKTFATDDSSDWAIINGYGGAGSVIANSGTMFASASERSQAYIRLVDYNGGNTVNSGTMLVSASDSSEAFVYLSNDGGTIVNAKTITAVATAQSETYAEFYGASSTVNSGTVEAFGGADSDAYIEFNDTTVNNTGGVVSASGNGAIYLDNATISGGTLQTGGSEAAVVVEDGDTITGATIARGTQVVVSGTLLTLGGGVTIGSGADVEAVYNGLIFVSGAVTNSGTLLAGDAGPGTIDILSGGVVDNVSGGIVEIGEDGTVYVASGGSVGIVAFGQNDNGTLEIADRVGAPQVFSGSVAGFGGVGGEFPDQLIVLDQIVYEADTFSASYTGTTQSGTLTVLSGGVAAADITLDGNYLNAGFTVSGFDGFVAISDPVAADGAIWTLASTDNGGAAPSNVAGAALLGSYMASLFASPEGQVGGQAATAETAPSQVVIAHPHTG